MKKQSGFTLIELMVVMAIIAILATAGLSAYTGYLKKARDTTRIEDVRAMNTIVMSALSVNGNPPADLAALNTLISAANNGQLLADPLGTAAVCLSAASGDSVEACGYQYYTCDGGAGYLISAKLESKSNQSSYTTIGSAVGYSIGTCPTGSILLGGSGGGGLGDGTNTECDAAGEECSDSSVYVTATLRTKRSDTGQYAWVNCAQCGGGAGCYEDEIDFVWVCSGSEDNPAELACENLGVGWRLPLQSELSELYANKDDIGNFDTSENWPQQYYLSSEESNQNDAYAYSFNTGVMQSFDKSQPASVRCVRTAN